VISGHFEFSVPASGLCASAATTPGTVAAADCDPVVPGSDDRFRDAFTRLCLYLAHQHMEDGVERANDLVLVGTEFGNMTAILRFLRQGRDGDPDISAQQFPHATASSASCYVNIAKQVRGGNATVNAGAFTPVVALLHALLHLQANGAGTSHVFVGDSYCDEALEDLRKTHPAARATPGVAYAALVAGSDLQGEIAFEDDDGSADRHGAADTIDDAARTREYNNAFHFHRLIAAAGALRAGEATVLAIRADGRRATVRIRRQGAH
jgi:hypothetical protein